MALTVPSNTPTTLPDLPTDPAQWGRIRSFLAGTKQAVEGLLSPSTAPGPVQSVTVVSTPNGAIVSWPPAAAGITDYVIYAAYGVTGLFSFAVPIGTVQATAIPRGNSYTFFDPFITSLPGSNSASAYPSTYWVSARVNGVEGPVSAAAILANSAIWPVRSGLISFGSTSSGSSADSSGISFPTGTLQAGIDTLLLATKEPHAGTLLVANCSSNDTAVITFHNFSGGSLSLSSQGYTLKVIRNHR
jgi:hypothetical protein